MLASFELSELSLDQRRDWLARAHVKALQAWRYELQGGPSQAPQWLVGLKKCAGLAIAALAENDARWGQLARVSQVPDSYSTGAQIAGLYPLVAPIVDWRARVTMGALAERFDHYSPRGKWQSYRLQLPELELPDTAGGWTRDSLGIPVFEAQVFDDLFRHHAPAWRIDTLDRNDQPGRPGRGTDGELRFHLEPVVFTQLAFSYVHGIIQPQLVYLIWFAARSAESWPDIYAGALDGLVWRVTLDDQGRALVYDSIHPCGCYHQWLLVKDGLRPRPSVNLSNEHLWVLGELPENSGAPVLSLSAGDHQLVGIQFAEDVEEPLAREVGLAYRMEPLDSLRGRSWAGGRLYGLDGLIAGTERLERFLLWPTGVVSAGAMRQWGHHAVSFVGRRHFNDPDLLDQYFRLLR
ncbi:hypothetical protein [Marinobacter similis]|uniref:Uncharacterized protein n=1 Tax=Marinobacter similis TaxID=1420916 RepID=W5YLT8_9GAMM|nr:hypothetical protein [Marinobacter similis]AHI30000.1 hypothetical protein AU14_04325 [Marinobacter similis]